MARHDGSIDDRDAAHYYVADKPFADDFAELPPAIAHRVVGHPARDRRRSRDRSSGLLWMACGVIACLATMSIPGCVATGGPTATVHAVVETDLTEATGSGGKESRPGVVARVDLAFSWGGGGKDMGGE